MIFFNKNKKYSTRFKNLFPYKLIIFLFFCFLFLFFNKNLTKAQIYKEEYNSIIISEFMPRTNDLPECEGKQWVELYNPSSKEISLNDYTIYTGYKESLKKRKLEPNELNKKSLLPQEYALFCNITLIDNPTEDYYISLRYQDSEINFTTYEQSNKNKSYSRQFDNFFIESEEKTPEKMNYYMKSIDEDSIVKAFYSNEDIFFSSPISTDSKTVYEWNYNFEQSVDKYEKNSEINTHTYKAKDTPYQVNLKKIQEITDYENQEVRYVELLYSEAITIIKNPLEYKDIIFISEILPNPDGADTDGEWIEIYNDSDKRINLNNFWISYYKEDSKYPDDIFVFEEDIFINPKEYLVLEYEDSGILITNSKEGVLKLGCFDKTIDSFYIDISSDKENQSLARDNLKNIKWTSFLTKGNNNIFLIKPDETEKEVKTTAKSKVNLTKKEVNNIKENKNQINFERISFKNNVKNPLPLKKINNDDSILSIFKEADLLMKGLIFGLFIVLIYIGWELSKVINKILK